MIYFHCYPKLYCDSHAIMENKIGKMVTWPVLSTLIQIYTHPSILVEKTKRVKWTTDQWYPNWYKSVCTTPSSATYCPLCIHITTKHISTLMVFYWLWLHMISRAEQITKFTALLHPLQKIIQEKGGHNHLLITRRQYQNLCLIKCLDGTQNWNGEILQSSHFWMGSSAQLEQKQVR